MKNIVKYFFVIIACVGCTLLCNMFLSPSIVDISKGTSNGIYDSYVVKYSNGKTDTITIKNGEDGSDVTVEDLYLATKTAKGHGDEYTILDFINEYMNFSVEEKDETKAYLGALSTVEVYCEFPTSIDYVTSQKSYGLSMGAGVIYQPKGEEDDYYILTNYHVVYNTQSLSSGNIATKFTCFLYGSVATVTTNQQSNGGYTFTYSDDAINCSFVGGSKNNDLAVLKVTNPDLIKNSHAKAVSVCDDDPVVGETVVAIGNPQGLGTSVTKGIISVDSEYMNMQLDSSTTITFRAIRFDASVNSGNSGGGLFNSKGQLIGIVNSKLNEDGIEGMAFALPAVSSVRVADNIIKSSSASAEKPVLGITIALASSKAVYNAETMNIKIVEEIKISEIDASSICYGKLAVGDIIKSVVINGITYEIDREYRLKDLLWLVSKNSVMYFNVIRSNNAETIPVVASTDCFVIVK